jgi:hypothetical protein
MTTCGLINGYRRFLRMCNVCQQDSIISLTLIPRRWRQQLPPKCRYNNSEAQMWDFVMNSFGWGYSPVARFWTRFHNHLSDYQLHMKDWLPWKYEYHHYIFDSLNWLTKLYRSWHVFGRFLVLISPETSILKIFIFLFRSSSQIPGRGRFPQTLLQFTIHHGTRWRYIVYLVTDTTKEIEGRSGCQHVFPYFVSIQTNSSVISVGKLCEGCLAPRKTLSCRK